MLVTRSLRIIRHCITTRHLQHGSRQTHSRSPVSQKRVLGAIAHINSGKTTTSEAMLYTAGALRRMGNVDAGDTTMDYLPTERERGITINSAAISFHWAQHQFFLVDSPGHLDFTFEVERALRVMDSAIVLLDAVAGVQPQTETVWRQADRNSLPRLVFVNKMDRDGADLHNTLTTIRQYFAAAHLLLQLPIFNEDTKIFRGVFDLLQRFPSNNSKSSTAKVDDKPSDYISYDALSVAQQAAADTAADNLVETLAEYDDHIMQLWLDGVPIARDELYVAIRQACLSAKLVPVLCGASLRGLGVAPLMDAVVHFLPSPLERDSIHAVASDGNDILIQPEKDSQFLAYAFKITHDRHRGRLVHLRAFSGNLDSSRVSFLNTRTGRTEIPNKVLRILADKFEEVDSIDAGDIFATVGLKHTKTGDTLVLRGSPKSHHVVLDGVRAPPAVFSIALEVDSSSQEKVLEEALDRLLDEDSSLELRQDIDTGETLLSGMGELHLEVAIDNLERGLSFPVHRSRPRVSYRETITDKATHTETVDTMAGSARLRASLHIEVEPLNMTHDQNEIVVDDRLSDDEREAVRNGIVAGLGRGPLTGACVTGVRVTVTLPDTCASHETAGLRACAGRGVGTALKAARGILLEPVMRVEVSVPDGEVGEIVGELTHPTRRRGCVEKVEADSRFEGREFGGVTNVSATVPVDGLIGFATRMRSITKGRGDLQMRFKEYRAVDAGTQDGIVARGGARNMGE